MTREKYLGIWRMIAQNMSRNVLVNGKHLELLYVVLEFVDEIKILQIFFFLT
jgi:hypothetical protein